MGYGVSEETVEYVTDDSGKEVVSKRKVSKKYISPDASALRLLIEHFYSQNSRQVENMTDEELEEERDRIIQMLKEEEKNATKESGE